MGTYDISNLYPGQQQPNPYQMQAGPAGQAMQAQGMGAGGAQMGGTGGVDPATIQALLGLNSQQGQQAKIARQLQMAQAMRAQGQAGMKQQTFGNGQVAAPNWAGAIANVYAAKKAGDVEKQADADTSALSKDREGALRRYFEALTSRGQQSSPMASGSASNIGSDWMY